MVKPFTLTNNPVSKNVVNFSCSIRKMLFKKRPNRKNKKKIISL